MTRMQFRKDRGTAGSDTAGQGLGVRGKLGVEEELGAGQGMGLRRVGVLVGAFAIVAAGVLPASSGALAAEPPGARATATRAMATLDAASVDRFVRDYVKQTRLPGAVVAVTRGGRVVHTAGYGHTASGETMTARTRVPVASLSKAMTAFTVMRLVEEGRVDLDRPVHEYLPEFTMADRRARDITVRQLLTQTSGMADTTYPDLTRHQPHTLKEAVAAMRGARLDATPGTRYRYHNPNYFVAARLVEVVAGRSFAEQLAKDVFGPLGMDDTRSVESTTQMPDAARGYVRAYGTTISLAHPRWFAAGGHGVVTSAEDLARWLIVQNNGGVSAEGRRVATARTIELTHTPPTATRDSDYAMGWRAGREDGGRTTALQHTGQLLTHNSMATLLPGTRTGIAVVTNTGLISGDDAAQITQGLVDLAQGGDPEVEAPFSMTADWFLAALTLLAVVLGTRGVVRAGRWARRVADRPWWRVALRLLPQALPILLLAQLATLIGLLMNRVGTLTQTAYAWPALVLCTAMAALASAAVITARLIAAYRHRRHRRHRRIQPTALDHSGAHSSEPGSDTPGADPVGRLVDGGLAGLDVPDEFHERAVGRVDALAAGVHVGDGELAGVQRVPVRQGLQPDDRVEQGSRPPRGVRRGDAGAGDTRLVAGDRGHEGGVVPDGDVLGDGLFLDVEQPGDVDVEHHQAASAP